MTTMTTTATTSAFRPGRLDRREVAIDPIALYLREIDEVPLLTADEEKALARRIAAGDEVARDRLIRANLRLVVRIARSYVRRGLSLQDLIQEGSTGLLRAVEGFNPEVGTRFSTYASPWIKQSITRALVNTARPIRIPAYMVALLCKWRRIAAELQRVPDCSPDDRDVAEAIGLDPKQADMVRLAIGVTRNQPRTGEEDGGFLDLVSGGSGDSSPLIADEERRHVHLILAEVERRDVRLAAVLRMRFGINGADPMSLREIGDVLGLTGEMIRLIEKKGMEMMAEIARKDGYWSDGGGDGGSGADDAADDVRVVGVGRSWTDEDIATLRVSYKVVPTEKLARILGRPPGAIRKFAVRLGISRRYIRFDEARSAELCRLVSEGRTDSEIARHFGCDRSVARKCRVRFGLPANGRDLGPDGTGQQTPEVSHG